jgi:hypothetical protein
LLDGGDDRFPLGNFVINFLVIGEVGQDLVRELIGPESVFIIESLLLLFDLLHERIKYSFIFMLANI